jgi:hypothetical protein
MTSEIRTLAAILALVAVSACGRGERAESAADSTARNLTLATPESTAVTGDVPPAATEEQPAAPALRTETPAPRPAAPRPAAPRPAAPATYTVAAGTRLHLGVTDTITSRTAKAGDAFTATVVEDITDAAGRVVVPAGATVQGTIVEVKPAPDPYTPGTLRLGLSSLTVRGQSYALNATIDSLETVRQGRGVTAGDAGKVAAGAAAGAVLGRIVGGNKTGTIIGGVVGAAAGAGVAHNTKDSDVVLPAGAHILATLAEALTIAAR